MERGKKKPQETPAEFIDKEMRQHAAAPAATRLKAARSSFRAFGLDASADDQLVRAVEDARRDYAGKFKANPDSYFQSHALLGLEDFARAYVIALNPKVNAKFGGGYALAEERSKTTTYKSYEEILRREVPGLDEQTIKELVNGAKAAVKELQPKTATH